MKTHRITKNDLLKLIRESNHASFEIAEPVTSESAQPLMTKIKQNIRQSRYVAFVIYPSN